MYEVHNAQMEKLHKFNLSVKLLHALVVFTLYIYTYIYNVNIYIYMKNGSLCDLYKTSIN